jgi:hypothetical protein
MAPGLTLNDLQTKLVRPIGKISANASAGPLPAARLQLSMVFPEADRVADRGRRRTCPFLKWRMGGQAVFAHILLAKCWVNGRVNGVLTN